MFLCSHFKTDVTQLKNKKKNHETDERQHSEQEKKIHSDKK